MLSPKRATLTSVRSLFLFDIRLLHAGMVHIMMHDFIPTVLKFKYVMVPMCKVKAEIKKELIR